MNKQQQIQHYKDTKGTPINQEAFTYINTKHLQIRSLIEFMDCLGYDYYMWDNTFVKQGFKGAGFKGCHTLSFITACNLHNSVWLNIPKAGYVAPSYGFVNKLGGGYYNQAFWTDAYTINKALASRIVAQVFLHVGDTGITCYKQQIKLLDPVYEALFVQPLIEKESTK